MTAPLITSLEQAGEGSRILLVDLNAAPFTRTFFDALNGYATGGSGRCLETLAIWNARLAASTPVGGWEEPDEQDVLDTISDAIGDSMDLDWTYSIGAKAIVEAFKREGWTVVAPPPPSVFIDKGSRPQEAVPTEQAAPPVLDWQPPRWPTKGTRLRFLGKNGYAAELEAALKVLTPDDIYTCVDCSVEDWSNSVSLEEVAGRYNGVMFEMVVPQPADGCSSNEGAGRRAFEWMRDTNNGLPGATPDTREWADLSVADRKAFEEDATRRPSLYRSPSTILPQTEKGS